MKATIKPLTQRPAWKALAAHHKKIQNLHLRTFFADDPKRGQRLTVEAADLYLDYSKNRITDQTLKLLVQLAEESDLSGRIAAMFSGQKINVTENRAVLHVALRAPKGATIVLDGRNVVPQVHAVLDKMEGEDKMEKLWDITRVMVENKSEILGQLTLAFVKRKHGELMEQLTHDTAHEEHGDEHRGQREGHG